MQFEGKVFLITGAARGIGAEVARQLAAQGAHLVLTDINAEAAMQVAHECTDAGAQALGAGCDITDPAAIAQLKAQALARFGRVDVLINNAAAQQFGPGDIDNIDLDRYRQSFEVNVLGAVRMVDAFLPEMHGRGQGYIVNTASSLAIRPNPVVQHMMPYVTSKGAMLTWSYALACALRPRGIGVSLFCPGLTATRPDGATVPQRHGWFARTPEALATPGTLQDCAAVLLDGLHNERFLISSEPDYAEALLGFAQAQLDPMHFSTVPATLSAPQA
jgi:NAD(P)-dependent dehydrogenase (short-subunit alcohol dehydrogenase family)